MVTAIIAAAGQGKRMNFSMNKVFMLLADKPVLLYSILEFLACPAIDHIIVVVASDEVELVENMLNQLTTVKTWQVVAGGSERQYSIANALRGIAETDEIVLVHDGARPLVTAECIESVIQAARQHQAAVVAVPVKDTIKIVNDQGVVTGTPERRTLWSIQTPQGFQTAVLRQAYQQALLDGYLGTDDASLVERIGVSVSVVPGSYKNIKVTTPEDLIIAEALIKGEK